jgi:iron complex outermembrane receptor protein
MYARDWGRQEWGFVNNVNFATNGLPKIFVLPNVRRNQLAAGGLIVSGPLAGTTFDANGEPRPFVFGSVNGSGTHSGGDGYAEDDGQGTPLEVPLDRGAGQMRLSFELTPDTEVFAEASYGYLYTAGVGPSPIDYNGTGLVIRDDNPYIPAALRQRMTDLGVTSFSLARYWKDDMNGDSVRLARPRTISENTSRSYTLGASGTLGSGWSWDVTSQYGATDQEYVGRGYRIQQRFYQSADAVVDPVSGEIVCRSTLTNPDNGCVPVNLFGRNAVSQEAWDYFTGTQRTRTTYHRTVHAANVHGEPFSTWAGDVSMALGLEYRKDRARMTQKEPLALARAFNYGNAQPIDGSIDVKEGYLEAVIPLAKDVKFVESLEFDGAVRATDYSTSGTVNTWKAGLNWTITDSVRFRGSVSRDIRAPNISELYTSVSQGILNAINPETGGNLTVTTLSSGNVDLEPEKARTYTGGFVFTPSFVPNLKLSFDYYDIEIDGVITSISGQTVINYCYEGVASFCSLIDSTSQATAIVRLPFLNLAGLKVKGWDVEAAYGFDLGAGRLDLNLFGTYQPEILVDNGTSAPIDRAGDMGRAGAPYGGPKWKWNAIAGYTVDNFSAALSVRYVGSGKKDVTYTAADIDNNKVDSATYVTLSLGYELPNVSGMDLRLYADVHNLLNEDPPVNPYSSSGYPYNPTFHDPIGRRFTVGVTAKF